MPYSGAASGARPLKPGDLDGYWPEGKRKEILNRGKYLVKNHLEVPPHIKAAYDIIQRGDGYDWNKTSSEYINKIIDSLPRRLFENQIWKRDSLREPDPQTSAPYYDIMRRALLAEKEFYGIDSESAGGKLLEQFYQPASVPGSFKNHLKASGVSIDKILHFSRTVCLRGNQFGETWPTLQLQLENRRRYFVHDLARYLMPKPKSSKEVKNFEYLIPPEPPKDPREQAKFNKYAFLEDGVLGINSRTLVFDTTLNSALLKLMQEVDIKPGVIIKQLTFWQDGDDDSREDARPDTWADFYDIPNWLRENYYVYYRQPGSGFIGPNLTVYIRKGKNSSSSSLNCLGG